MYNHSVLKLVLGTRRWHAKVQRHGCASLGPEQAKDAVFWIDDMRLLWVGVFQNFERQLRLLCARNKGRAVCTNKTLIKQADLEARVLEALAHHLMDPEAVTAFCEAYTAERNRLAASATNTRSDLERKLAQVKRDHAKLVDAIIAGVPADQVKDKMISLDEQRVRLETKLEATQASPAPLRFHPTMAETYRDRVGVLIEGLGREDGLEETREALRGLIE